MGWTNILDHAIEGRYPLLQEAAMADKTIFGLYQTGDDVMPPLMIFGLPLCREPVLQDCDEKTTEVVSTALSIGLAKNTRHDAAHYASDISNFARYLVRDIMPNIPGAVHAVLTDGGIGMMREVAFTDEAGEVLMSGFLYGKEFQNPGIPLVDTPELFFHMCFLANTYPDALSDVMYETNKSISLMNLEWKPAFEDLHVCSRYFAPSLKKDGYDMINAIYHGSINEIRSNAFEVQARSILKLPHVEINQGLIDAFQRILNQKDIIITPTMMIQGSGDIATV